jgi:hypothetical protein
VSLSKIEKGPVLKELLDFRGNTRKTNANIDSLSVSIIEFSNQVLLSPRTLGNI